MTTKPTAMVILKQNALFRNLPDGALDTLTRISTRRKFTKDQLIFSQGDVGDVFYGVLSGCVRLSATSADGQEVHLKMVESGESFGEIAILDGEPRTASALAVQPSELIAIERDQFWCLLDSEPELAIHLLKFVCGKVRWTSELVEQSVFLDVPARIAKRLVDLADQHGKPNDKGIELAVGQGELATYLGLSRQIVHRYLQQWRNENWVAVARGRIYVVNRSALVTFIESRGDAD